MAFPKQIHSLCLLPETGSQREFGGWTWLCPLTKGDHNVQSCGILVGGEEIQCRAEHKHRTPGDASSHPSAPDTNISLQPLSPVLAVRRAQ